MTLEEIIKAHIKESPLFSLKIDSLNEQNWKDLKEFEKIGLIDIKLMIVCPECGSDISEIDSFEEIGKLAVTCETCEEEFLVEPQDVVVSILLTKKGKHFFRSQKR